MAGAITLPNSSSPLPPESPHFGSSSPGPKQPPPPYCPAPPPHLCKQSLGLSLKAASLLEEGSGPPSTTQEYALSFTLFPKQNRQHYLSEFWLVKATPICKAEEASPGSFSPTTQRNDSPRDRTWHGPQKARGWPPTHWHTLRILAVLWDWGAAKPQLHQNKEGTGAYRGGGGGARQGTPHIHKHRFSAGKALRTNPENSVKGRGVCIPPTES